jgi:uncharacterized protein
MNSHHFFDLTQVRLLNGPFRDAMQRDQAYLLSLDTNRLLHNFRKNAGLPSTAEPYGGWEAPESELRGHFLGHYLSACSMMFASTGILIFKQRVDELITGLAQVQAVLSCQVSHPGYLSAFPESFFDRVEHREPVWAPFYTLHKLMAGLLDAFSHVQNDLALEILEKIAGWLQARVERLSHEQMQIVLLAEFGGMNEVLANLCAVTGKPEHLRLSLAFNDDLVFDPLARGEDRLDRMHANTQIPKIIGAARQYELTSDSRYYQIVRFFWQQVAFQRSYAIGGNSDDELFFPVDKFCEHLSPVTAESCNTYNMLKLTRHLFAWSPSSPIMDFYERALYNHILGSQDPETGMMIYFASLKPGHFKVYNTPEHSFWCCTGSGVENHAKYGDTIYSHDDQALYVNLFIASELTWEEKGLRVRQETDFPDGSSTRVTLTCERPTLLPVKIRVPSWSADLTIEINGQAADIKPSADSYVSLEQVWHSGDQIEVQLSPKLHIEKLPGSDHLLAVLYGPIVLAGALGTEHMPDVYLKDLYTRITPVNSWPAPQAPYFCGSDQEILSHIEPVAGQPLTFRTHEIGKPSDVELKAFYKLHHQRYTVYWKYHPKYEMNL